MCWVKRFRLVRRQPGSSQPGGRCLKYYPRLTRRARCSILVSTFVELYPRVSAFKQAVMHEELRNDSKLEYVICGTPGYGNC